MRCKYPTRDLSQRLDSTVCMYNNIPVYVRYTGESDILDLFDLDQSNNKPVNRIRASDPLFDISTPPLGFIQATPDSVCFLMRRPLRVYKQGLSNENVSFNSIGGSKNKLEQRSIRSKAVKDMILNRYKNLDAALNELTNATRDCSIAISRDVCLEFVHKNRIIHVYYRGVDEPVGWMILGTRTVIVPSNDFGWVISKYISGLTWEVR